MAASVSAVASHGSPLLDPILLSIWLVLGAVVVVLAAFLVARANRRFSGRLEAAPLVPEIPYGFTVPAQGGAPVLRETEVGIA
jgi:hypothetical protein